MYSSRNLSHGIEKGIIFRSPDKYYPFLIFYNFSFSRIPVLKKKAPKKINEPERKGTCIIDSPMFAQDALLYECRFSLEQAPGLRLWGIESLIFSVFFSSEAIA